MGRPDGDSKDTAEPALTIVAGAACQVTDIVRPQQRPEDRTDSERPQRISALTSAYHLATVGPDVAAEPVVFGWLRRATNVEVLVAGAGVVGPPGESAVAVSLPPGGRGRSLDLGELLGRCQQLPAWTRLAAISDSSIVGEVQPAQHRVPPTLDDCLLDTWPGPFGWLVIATPVAAPDMRELTERVSRAERVARAHAASSPDEARNVEQLRDRHRELRQAQSLGLWRITLLAGGQDGVCAPQVAALLAASVDLTGLSYTLVVTPGCAGFDVAARQVPGADPVDTAAACTPFIAGTPMLAALTRGPEREVAGVRQVAAPDFDVTPESGNGPALAVGRIRDRGLRDAGPMMLPLTSLNRHTFVAGATGAGKSQTVRGLLEEATAAGVPWLVLEPAKAEYRAMAARLSGTAPVTVIRPGLADSPAAGLNPLRPEPGFPLQTHIDLVRALFLAAFRADEPFPQVLAAALSRCYEDLGWDLALGEPRGRHAARYPTLADLQQTAEQVVTDIGYGSEVRDNVRGFVSVRLASLRLGTTGRFFQNGHPIDMGRLLATNAVIEIEDVGDDQDKAFLMGTVIIRLVEHLRIHPGARSGPLRHLTVIEEAHRLLPRESGDGPTAGRGPAGHAVELFAAALAETRAYGEGIVVVEQIPNKISVDVLKNTAVKIVHRLPAGDDRETVGATMNLTDPQSRYLVSIPPGRAAVFTDGMDHPVLVDMPDGTAREHAPAAAGPVVDVAGRRSTTCGTLCRAQPCTLREMVTARRVADDRPGTALGAELTVLACVTGHTVPRPRTAHLPARPDVSARIADCALGQHADAAVSTRARYLAPTVDADALAGHVAGLLRTDTPTPSSDQRWLAPVFRWNLVARALTARLRENPAAGRHPDSDQWQQMHGMAVPGETCRDQQDQVRTWQRELLADEQLTQATIFGEQHPSDIEDAVGGRRSASDWPDRVSGALRQFSDATWAEPILLYPVVAPAPTRRRKHER